MYGCQVIKRKNVQEEVLQFINFVYLISKMIVTFISIAQVEINLYLMYKYK